MSDIFATTDKTKEQAGQGADQLYILKQGLIQIAPADFSGLNASVSEEVYRISGNSFADIGLNNFDIFHHIQDAAAELPDDEEIRRLNYNDGDIKANAKMAWKYNVGAPGFLTVTIYIDYTADDTTGSPYSADETQNFYYTIYSMKPIVV